MKANINQLAKAFLEAREAFAIAEAAKKEADLLLKQAMEKAGTDSVTIDGDEVRLVPMPGDRYDAETLRGLVSPALFKKVTTLSVDNKKIKAIIELGLITQDVVDAANVGKPFTQLRVYDAKDAGAVATTKKAKVA